ncbi:MAG: phosphotransferase [Chloroflexi bacterium]|nr:phosphotransferase [Chloroflexota bacterium]
MRLADGRRYFFKGAYPLPADSGVSWVLQEEELVYQRLGELIAPWAPAHLGTIRQEGWHALLLEDLGGSSVLPWTAEKAQRAAKSYASFHQSTYAQPLPGWLPRDAKPFGACWSQLDAETGDLGRLANLAGSEAGAASEWLADHVAALCRAEAGLAAAREPFVLMHVDTRSDNIRLQGDLLRLFDWPFAAVGPHEFDLAAFAQSIEAEGGPCCEDVAAWYADVLPLRRDVLGASIAAIAGYFADRAPRPPVEGLPRLRSVQRRQLKASLGWAARALGLATPTWLASVAD